jgi:acyl-CoA synthetase (AMP-forming)/AMP-acid ligase II
MTNLVERLYTIGKEFPERVALEIFPGEEKYTYREVIENVDAYRRGLKKLNLDNSSRTLLLLKPSGNLFFIILALFAEGLVPLLIDPRLQKRHWIRALKKSNIQLIFSEQELTKFKFILPFLWKVKWYSVGKAWGRIKTVRDLMIKNSDSLPLPTVKPESIALSSLSSGTTGQTKTIERTFNVLITQQNLACKYLPSVSEDRHLPGYIVSLLQSLIEGAENYFMVDKNPKLYLDILQNKRVTRLTGPPGFIYQIAKLARNQKLSFPIVENIIVGGAPISESYVSLCQKIFPNAKLHIFYGATEAEPIAFTDAKLCSWEKLGYPVGQPVPEIHVHRNLTEFFNLTNCFEVGISGDHVATKNIHWTGDIAFEHDGQLHLAGRKNETLVFNNHCYLAGLWESELERSEYISRVALQSRKNILYVYFETLDDNDSKKYFEFFKNYFKNRWPGKIQIVGPIKMPVDPRHLWKVQRRELKKL